MAILAPTLRQHSRRQLLSPCLQNHVAPIQAGVYKTTTLVDATRTHRQATWFDPFRHKHHLKRLLYLVKLTSVNFKIEYEVINLATLAPQSPTTSSFFVLFQHPRR